MTIMKISYDNLVKNAGCFIEYCTKTSDRFSIIVDQRRSMPKESYQDDKIAGLSPYMIKQIEKIKGWPGTSKTSQKYKMMNIYGCCKQSRYELMNIGGDLFTFSYRSYPEDITFYRKDRQTQKICPWLVTTSHEELAFMLSPTLADEKFMQKENIGYGLIETDNMTPWIFPEIMEILNS